jgi:hypothetical protein
VTDPGPSVFRRFHKAWTRGDLDSVLSLVEPDIVVRPLHGAMFTRSEFRGPEGVADWYREMTEPGDPLEALVEGARDRPPDGVLGLVKVVGYRGDDGSTRAWGSRCPCATGASRG